MNEDNELKKAHPMSLKGVFNQYTVSKIFRSGGTLVSLIITIAIVIGIYHQYHTINDYYNMLIRITNTVLSLLPNILGFCIGGYALIIGACSTDTIKKMSAPYSEKHNYSLYQILSSVFAATLIIQCFTLVVAYIVHFCLLFEFSTDNVSIGAVVNISVLFILLFLFCLSISLLYYTIINIFNLGQTMHFCVRLDNETQTTKKENKDNEQSK